MIINKFSVMIFIAAAFLASIVYVIYIVTRDTAITDRASNYGKKEDNIVIRLYKYINKPIKENLRRSGLSVKITPERMILIMSACSITGILFGLALNNYVVAIMLQITGALLPMYWLKTQVVKSQNKITELSSVCIHVLITSFHFGVSIPNFKLAIEQMQYPLKKHFDRMISQLLAGQDVNEVYADFCDKVDNKYLRFAVKNILVSLVKGTDVIPILFSLMESVQNEKIRIAKINKASSEASFLTLVSIVIAALIIIGYAVLSPQFLQIYITTSVGKFAVAVLVAVIIFVMYTFEKIKQIEV